MLVYPDKEEVELYYGYVLSDNIGQVFSVFGLFVLATITLKKFFATYKK
jgi:hypothetical protein